MKITYVLAFPELNGGHKVALQHAELLRSMGDEVTVLAEGPKPDWSEAGARWVDTTRDTPELPPQDLVIATYWTTISRALALEAGPVAHLCQGYEGALPHALESRAEIEAAYSLPLPALTVSPHLSDLLRDRFGRESRVVPPPLDPRFRPAVRLRPSRRPWIVVPGIFESEVKGVRTALAAVARIREQGVPARLLRISAWELGDEERGVLPADRALCGVRPREVADALRRCDLLLMPSREQEGFGLPLLEAMASKVPAIASRIPSVTAYAGDGATLVPPDDAEAFAEAALRLLRTPSAWRAARSAGWAVAQRFTPVHVAPRLREAVRWASATALVAPPRQTVATS